VRIGIDAHILGKGKGGVERYVRHLVEGLPPVAREHEFVVFVNRRFAESVHDHENVRFVRLPFADPILERSLVLPLLARRHRLDALQVQRIAPLATRSRLVVDVHDLVPLKDPENYRGIRNFLIRRLTPGSVRRAWRIVVPTEVVRREVLQRFGMDERRVVAIPRGVDHQQFCPADSGDRPPEVLRRLDIRGPYMLYVGAIEPRRNLEVVLRALARLRAGGLADVAFVMTGGVRSNAYARALADLAANLGLTGSVVQTGYVDDADLVGLLRHARLVVAPSWGEGFNMPPLEAMACGTPVVCSDIEVHRELLAGSACFFDAASDERLAEVMDRLWSDSAERARLRKIGLERASVFTWEKTACQTAAMYRSLADPSAA